MVECPKSMETSPGQGNGQDPGAQVPQAHLGPDRGHPHTPVGDQKHGHEAGLVPKEQDCVKSNVLAGKDTHQQDQIQPDVKGRYVKDRPQRFHPEDANILFRSFNSFLSAWNPHRSPA